MYDSSSFALYITTTIYTLRLMFFDKNILRLMKSKKTIAIFYSYGVRLLLAEKAKGPYKAETKHSNTVCSKRKKKKR